jgi:3-methyl-2-oxobutanoate hydroxymethyltransferase
MKKWNVATIKAAKGVQKLGCVTAYDACFARLADEAGAPIILVGDSMGMVVKGYPTTLPLTLDEMFSATAAVVRGTKDALVVCDLPFGSYQCGDDEAMKNAVKALQLGADAVKIEGGAFRAPLIKRMVDNGIPVIAHIGLTPQSVNAFGGFKVQGKTQDDAERILEDAKILNDTGAFALTLECIPSELAAKITLNVDMVTIGIGAGPSCDAQWLVMHDLLGLNEGHVPSFVKKYASLAKDARDAFSKYIEEVASGTFPN